MSQEVRRLILDVEEADTGTNLAAELDNHEGRQQNRSFVAMGRYQHTEGFFKLVRVFTREGRG